MLNINSSKTVPALVHSADTSTTSRVIPVTPTSEAISVSFPTLNKRSSLEVLKTRLTKFKRSTKSMFNRTAKASPIQPFINTPNKVLVEQEIVRDYCPALSPRYHETNESLGSYLYIPLPCFPSQVSLIPLHDGHVLPSPAAENNEEDIISFASLACLAEQRCINHGESAPPSSLAARPSSLAPPPQASSPVITQVSQTTPSGHGERSFPASLTCSPTERLNISHAESSRPFCSRAAYSQTSSAAMIRQRSPDISQLAPLSWILISTCTAIGIAATAVSWY